MKNNWEKEWDYKLKLEKQKAKQLSVIKGTAIFFQPFSKDFFRQLLKAQRKEIINEFIKGKRCFHCGKLKERGLSDWCGKCLEEA